MKNLRFPFFLFFSERIFFTIIKKAASFLQSFFHLIYLILIFPKIDLAQSKSQVFSKTKSHSVTALIDKTSWEKNKTKIFCKNVLHETYLSLNLKIMWRKNKEINVSIIAEQIYQRDSCIFICHERND